MQTIVNTRFKFFKNQKEMTLIELLAVIVVLGVIAAIAVPAIGGTVTSSKTKSDLESIKIIEAAAVRYAYDLNPNGDPTPATPVSGAVVTVAALNTAGY